MNKVFDRGNWGRIRLTGADRVRFLHNQTTNNIEQLSAGRGCHTVFVTSTGRTIDLATVYAMADSLLVIVSPGMDQQLYDWMDRYIFFSDKVTLTNESEQTFMFTVLGDDSAGLQESLGLAEMPTQAFTHQLFQIAGEECLMSTNSDLGLPGYTFIGPKAVAEPLWSALTKVVTTPGTAEEWETLRVMQGRPMPSQELTEDENPLEAGLWHSISFEKGCYIGQETIARLNTYQGVKKRLWGFQLQKPVAPGAVIYVAETKVGNITSVTQTPDDTLFALGYLRTKAGGEGLSVEIEGVSAEAIALPFIKHEYQT
ncbi:MAG: glycine cleavage T C-terminal barrel domain-containing protein [Cyanobacteria bacterium J06597_16]